MAELSRIADWVLRTLTGMPGTSPVVHIDLIRAVIGDARDDHDVLAELVDAGRAVRVDSTHYQFEVVEQPASDDPTGYGIVVMSHAIKAAGADKAIHPGGRRTGFVYERAAKPFGSPVAAVAWFRSYETRLLQMLNGAIKYDFYDVACELAEPLWALARYIGHHSTETLTQFATLNVLDAFDDEKREHRRTTALIRLAYGLSSMGSHDEALANADSAVQHAAELGDRLLLSLAYSAQGRAHHFVGDLAPALAAYTTSLAIAEKTDDLRSIALRHLRLASVQAATANTASALTHLHTAEKLMTELGDAIGLARVLTCLGRTLLDSGHHAEAYMVIVSTFDTLKSAANDLYLAEAASVAGAAAEHTNPAEARGHYILALTKFDACGLSARAGEMQRRLNELDGPTR